eukprot:m.395202 g.395202  ORF g.395202 m.395202 type:complete len:88 (-) comp21099_c0_seq19:1710-1973(-)
MAKHVRHLAACYYFATACSAWLMEDEEEEKVDAVDEDKSAEFKKFQLLNEQQRERESKPRASLPTTHLSCVHILSICLREVDDDMST